MSWQQPIWGELDRPIKYAIRGVHSIQSAKIVPVKVWSMAPNWNGTTLARTLTLFEGGDPNGTNVDYRYTEIFETKEEALTELFLRQLKGKN